MAATLTILAALALAAWLGLAFLRHGFWRADQRLADAPAALDAWPAVSAIVPARNEADGVGRAVASLLGQDYPARVQLILVDDGSSDGTADVARAAAARLGAADRLTILAGAPLPKGWAGKLWAVEQGVRHEAEGKAPYLLLTDADIEHDPLNLRRLVAKAESERLDLVSLMVRLHCATFWERLLIPAFVFFFQMLYPFPAVNARDPRVAAAAGGCMLVRRTALERAGGIAAIRNAIIDDCALARLIKGQGGAIWLGLAERVSSLRVYRDLSEIWRMVARSAYTQLDHSPLLLALTILAMLIVYLVPPAILAVGVATGHWLAAALAFAAWATMARLYRPTLALYGASLWNAWLLPAAASLYLAMTIDSARRHWRGEGGAWKGRHYPGGLRPSP
ncbi:MAG TPA: glycosyltransferase [Alphaproteobacteria bacterium]|nr:glycosyltransferase [Alphaproteobacteria bacterium]